MPWFLLILYFILFFLFDLLPFSAPHLSFSYCFVVAPGLDTPIDGFVLVLSL